VTDKDHGPTHYWERHTPGDGTWCQQHPLGPPGDELAALRRGVGREPGDVPAMWPHYTQLRSDGRLTSALRAEHAALTLFAVHQQSQRWPAHRSGVGIGSAVLQLRRHKDLSPEAVDRRFAAAATATTISELHNHLRGLVTQLRTISHGLDYTQLFRDLHAWQVPDRVGSVRRRWGAQYFDWSDRKPDRDPAASITTASA
jgi:CRISPR system Cascade subunit CasB